MAQFTGVLTTREIADAVYRKYGDRLGKDFAPSHIIVTMDEGRKQLVVKLEERY
jgi:hypothetical protein